MPVGFLITVGLVALAMATSLRPPARAGLAGLATWLVSAILNESPFLAFYYMVASILLAWGNLPGSEIWLALAITFAPFAGAPVLVRRSLRAAPAIQKALLADMGHVELSPPTRVPWWRVVLAPLPLLHPGVRRIANISYGDAGRSNKLDLYRRRNRASVGPVLIHLHGGGFWFTPGRKSFYARRLLFRFARKGWVCISATYRLQPKAAFPDELVDVKKVIAWARAHAAEHGGDPDRIVLAGSSFGARLATLAGFTANEPTFQPGFEEDDTSVSAVVGLYGYYGGIASIDSLPSSPFDYADRLSAPLMLVHGDQDTFTSPDRARALADRARDAAQHRVVYVELPGAQHSFDLLSSVRFEAVIDGIESFATAIHTRATADARTSPNGRNCVSGPYISN